ncbi:unnamed protein product [Prorocentrum cordatum]|uniref:Uncharacterized protein n=1 Tax=Prorocentrum cordatum TaxID=2364126 RepID=A0ABN9U0T4_9DINO|nr:unnamed protein product [Polarella glacialis]
MAPPRSTVHDSTVRSKCPGEVFRKRRGGERAPPRWSAPKRGVGCRGHSARPPETCSLPGQLPERGEEGEEERREGRRWGARKTCPAGRAGTSPLETVDQPLTPPCCGRALPRARAREKRAPLGAHRCRLVACRLPARDVQGAPLCGGSRPMAHGRRPPGPHANF